MSTKAHLIEKLALTKKPTPVRGPVLPPGAPLTVGPRPPGTGGWQWQEETSRPETGGALSPSARLEAFAAPCHTPPRHSVECGKTPPVPRVLRVCSQCQKTRQSVASCAHCVTGKIRPWN